MASFFLLNYSILILHVSIWRMNRATVNIFLNIDNEYYAHFQKFLQFSKLCLNYFVKLSTLFSTNKVGLLFTLRNWYIAVCAIAREYIRIWHVFYLWPPCVGGWKCRTQKLTKKSPSGHHSTTLPGHIFANKARIHNRKKIVKQQYILHMSSQYSELRPTAAEIDPVVWGTPANFNGFRVLAALLHGTPVLGRLGVSHTLRR